MNLVLIFTLAILVVIMCTSNFVQGRCEVELRECKQLLDPIYQQPVELLQRFQKCSLSLYEEQLKTKECEIKMVSRCIKNVSPATCDVSCNCKPIGVEGKWEQILARTGYQPPPGAIKNTDDGNLIAWTDYVARTWIGENTVPCRTNFNTWKCFGTLDMKHFAANTFEVLVGDYTWMWTNSSTPIPSNALIGGFRTIPETNNREILYVGRAIHSNFENHGVKPNRLLIGHVSGNTRELIHAAWEITQRKTIYQILVQT